MFLQVLFPLLLFISNSNVYSQVIMYPQQGGVGSSGGGGDMMLPMMMMLMKDGTSSSKAMLPLMMMMGGGTNSNEDMMMALLMMKTLEKSSATHVTHTHSIFQKCSKCGVKKSGTTNDGVAQGEYPWYALISSVKDTSGSSIADEDKFLCAGTLINSKWVVTSATCLHEWQTNSYTYGTKRSASDLRVRLGEHTISSSISSYATEHRVDRIVIHEDYDVSSSTKNDMLVYFTGDIALLRLDSHADISKYTPACLPADSESFFGKFGVLTGFNLPNWDTSDDAQSASHSMPTEIDEVLVIPHDICDNFFYVTDTFGPGNSLGFVHGDINDKHICVATHNTRDTCNADEGGPLIVDNGHGQYILVGVLNSQVHCGDQGQDYDYDIEDPAPLSPNRYWGAHAYGALESEAGGMPLTYAKVSKHVNWLNQAMLDNEDEEPEKCHS